MTYKSEATAAIHEMIEGLHDAGSIDKRTMREFDEACLAPAPVFSPEEIELLSSNENLLMPSSPPSGYRMLWASYIVQSAEPEDFPE